MKQTCVFLFLLATIPGFAQRFDILSGKLESLKGISEYDVTFDYSGLEVHGFDSEEAFLKDKMNKRPDQKAQKFKEDWYGNREALYEPAFIAYFNMYMEKDGVKVAKNPQAKYTMNIKTTWVYPGYNGGTAMTSAKISAVITITETANPDKILLAIEFDKSIGLQHQQGNTDGDRISWAYEKLAKTFGMQLKRVL